MAKPLPKFPDELDKGDVIRSNTGPLTVADVFRMQGRPSTRVITFTDGSDVVVRADVPVEMWG